ncbi:MAG: hypothetical protein QM662_13840 [Gordonia sp. (in: high G+C Gram-positive bacteria)]
MMQFPERWELRPPRTTVADPVTGNRLPGAPAAAISVAATWEQRFPRTEARQVGAGGEILDESELLVHPAAADIGITTDWTATSPAGDVYAIVRIPRVRRRRRPLAPPRYVALVIRRATNIPQEI